MLDHGHTYCCAQCFIPILISEQGSVARLYLVTVVLWWCSLFRDGPGLTEASLVVKVYATCSQAASDIYSMPAQTVHKLNTPTALSLVFKEAKVQ